MCVCVFGPVLPYTKIIKQTQNLKAYLEEALPVDDLKKTSYHKVVKAMFHAYDNFFCL